MNSGIASGAMTRSASEALATAAAAGVSAKAGKRPVRALSPQEKLVAIMRVHEGESKASVARDIGVPESTLRGWCKNEAKITNYARQSSSPESSDPAEPRAKKARTSSEPAAGAVAQAFGLSLRTRSGGGGGGGTADSRHSYSPLQDASPAAVQALSRSLARRQSPPAAHTASRNLHLNGGGSAGRAADELSADLDPMARSNSTLARMAAEMVAAGSADYPTASAYGAQLLRWSMQSSARPPNSTKKSTPLNIDTASNGHRLSTLPGTRTGASLLTTVTPSRDSGLTADAKSAQDNKFTTWVQQQHQIAFAQTYLQQLSNGLSTTAASTSSNAILTTAAPPALSTAAAAAAASVAAMDPAYSAALRRMMSDNLANWYLYSSDLASLQTAVSTPTRTRKHSAAAQAAPATGTTTTTAAPAPAPAAGSADDADKRILHQQLTRQGGSVSPKKTPDYVEEEQEVAEDLSTSKDRMSNVSETSPAGRPSSGLSSSMSLPSPSNPTSNSAPLAESPQPTLDPAKAFPDLAGQCARSGAALDDPSDADATAKQQPQPQLLQGGKAPARKVVRPRRHLNSVLALLENRHSDAPEDRQADAEPGPAAGDWRAAVTHGEAFVRWLETCRDASVTSFQINTIKSMLSNITKNGRAKENH